MSARLFWRRVAAGRHVAPGYVIQLDAHGRWWVTRTAGALVGFRRKLSEAQGVAENDLRGVLGDRYVADDGEGSAA